MPLELHTLELAGFIGLDTRYNRANKDPRYLENGQNIDFDEDGMIIKRRGCVQNSTYSGRINMIYDFQTQLGFEDSDDTQRVLIAHGEILSLIEDWGGGGQAVSKTFSITNAVHYACSSNNGVCYISNENSGIPYMLAYVGGDFIYQSAELDAPASAPTVAAGDTGSLSGSYQVRYSYNDAYGNESNPSEASEAVDLSDEVLDVVVTASSDPTIESISMYVLAPSDTVYRYVGTYSNTSGTLSVSVTDTEITGGDQAEYDRYPCPEGRYVTIFNDMLIVAGGDLIPDQIFCSHWLYHREFNIDEDYDRATSKDAQPVKGFGNLFSELVVAKADSRFIASGSEHTSFHTRPHDQDRGILGQPSTLSFNKRMAFFADDGIFVDSGDIPQDLSAIIRPTIRRLNPANLMDRYGAPKQFCIHDLYYKRLLFAVRSASGEGENDTILIYNYEIGGWTIYKGIEITAFGRVQIYEDWEYLFGGDSSGNVFIFSFPGSGQNNDSIDGSETAIEAFAETVWIHLPKAKGLPNWERTRTEAAWLNIYAGGQPASGNSTIGLTTYLYTDFDEDTVRGTYSLTFSADDWPANVPIEPKLIQSLGGDEVGSFEWLKLKFENNNAGEHFKIFKLVFGFRVKPTVES